MSLQVYFTRALVVRYQPLLPSGVVFSAATMVGFDVSSW